MVLKKPLRDPEASNENAITFCHCHCHWHCLHLQFGRSILGDTDLARLDGNLVSGCNNLIAKTKPLLKQVAALPTVETADGPLVLLITTRRRRRWTIPKGWPKPSVSNAELAAREAFEEAGVEGDIGSEPVGHFIYNKRLHIFAWAQCFVEVYQLSVRHQQLDWPEKQSRQIKWVAPDKGAAMIRDPELADFLRNFPANGRLNHGAHHSKV